MVRPEHTPGTISRTKYLFRLTFVLSSEGYRAYVFASKEAQEEFEPFIENRLFKFSVRD